MKSQVTEKACAFAWRNYLLLHSGISENDSRRSALYRYVTNVRDTGQDDFGLLQVAAVTYLKKLDELHDDRGARLAADRALDECAQFAGNYEKGVEETATTVKEQSDKERAA